MLSPEPMRYLALVVLARDMESVARAVARVGVLHLLDVRRSAEIMAAIRPFEVNGRREQLDALARDLGAAMRFLGVMVGEPEASAPAADGPDLSDLRSRTDAILAELDLLRTRLGVTGEERAALQNLQRNLRALAPLGMPLENLRELRWVYLASGLLPARNLARLRDSVARVGSLILSAGDEQADGRILIAALCLQPDREVLDRALRSAQLERVDLPAGLDGLPDEALAGVEAQLGEQTRRLAAIEQERAVLAQRHAAELQALWSLVARERVLLEARALMGLSERTALITGWVPAVVAPLLEGAVREATAGNCVVRWQEPGALDEVRQGRIAVPILLRNPVLVRPFERLLRAYGLPRWGEVEPTPLVAVAFLTMFGFMFGDLGQGLILFAVGYFIYRRMFRYRDYAVILMECGVFAGIFGVLYGSVFGIEDVLPALWLRPLHDIPTLMRTAVAFGAGLLSLGLLLNLINAVRRRDLAALWGHNGLLVAVTYWVAVGLFLRWLLAGPEAVPMRSMALWLSVPLLLVLFKNPVRVAWQALHGAARPGAAEIFSLAIESVVELIDTVVAAISNTATFVRLAAFALAHAGLLLATLGVAEAVAMSGAGTPGAVLVVLAGNLVVVALEGVIVAVQGVRLEYYEFFSRFYGGGGEEYRPLRVGAPQAARP